jgi:hypothetical protein
MNDQIAIQRAVFNRFVWMGNKRAVGDRKVMVVDKFFPLEMQFRHSQPLQKYVTHAPLIYRFMVFQTLARC